MLVQLNLLKCETRLPLNLKAMVFEFTESERFRLPDLGIPHSIVVVFLHPALG